MPANIRATSDTYSCSTKPGGQKEGRAAPRWQSNSAIPKAREHLGVGGPARGAESCGLGRAMKRQSTFSRAMSKSKDLRPRTSHVHVAQSFEGTAGLAKMFTVRGSSMFSKPVLIRSIIAAALGQFYYVVNNMRPDNKLENISPFYFMVLGSCLSFLVVFKSNMAYSRFWEVSQ